MMKLKLLPLFALAALSVAACSSPTAPPTPAAARWIPLNVEYRQWWGEVEQCSGLSRSIDDITFFAVPSLPNSDVGAYYTDGSRIYLVEIFKNDELVIKHEMMHALLQNVSGHPAHYFSDVCGDLMGADRTD
jgi:hypothetical protein